MRVPLVLFLVSLGGVLLFMTLPGYSDLALLAGLCALASLLIFLFALLRMKPPAAPVPRWIIVDGSNVMYWKDGTVEIQTVRDVLDRLVALGFSPGVVFDANAGHLIAGRYLHHADFGRLLRLPEDRVMVVDKGTPADATILAAARDLGAKVVTNDRYRDWLDRHPELHGSNMLIRGGYQNGRLWLALDEGTMRDRVTDRPAPRR